MKHVAHIGEKRNAIHVFMEKHEGRNHLEDLCIEGRILFKMHHKEMGCKDVDYVWLRMGTIGEWAVVRIVMSF